MDTKGENKEEDPQLKSLNILINGVKVAQKRGAYELQEAEILWNAIKTFIVDESKEGENADISLTKKNINA